MVNDAKAFNLPDSAFATNESRPWQLDMIVSKALKQKGLGAVIPASAVMSEKSDSSVQLANYDPATDKTHNAVVGFNDETSRTGSGVAAKPTMHAMEMYRSGLAAMDNEDHAQAREYLQMAWSFKDELDPGTQRAIQDKLVALSSATVPASQKQDTEEIDLSGLQNDEQLLFRNLQKEVLSVRNECDKLMSTDPREALQTMTSLRSRVAGSDLSANAMTPLLTIIDRDINDAQKFIQGNLPQIMNDEANQSRLETLELTRERKYEVEQQIQQLTEDFNKLMDQERFGEAEVIARQVADLAPGTEHAALLLSKSNMVNRTKTMESLGEIREQNQWAAIGRDMELAATPMDTSLPVQFGPAEDWQRLSSSRLEQLGLRQYRSETERRIWNTLKNQQIQGEFRGSLSEAMNQMAYQSGLNINYDNIALRAESVDVSTTSIDQSFPQPISMQSAMNVLLGSVGLTFIVEDEVIKVTSKDAQRKKVETKTYYVGDLISPVTPPNAPSQMNFITPHEQFNTQNTVLASNGIPSVNQMGGSSALALAQQMPGGAGMFGNDLAPVMALNNGYGGSGGPQRGVPMFTTSGAPQLGGITIRDFQPLMSLIETTIAPDDWQNTQGEGTISPYVNNLSLIVSQTQEVHDQIQDLLSQLRKLNDVQIVVEVRFITLSDNFFERIGVDFDFAINDNSGLTANQAASQDRFNPGVIVGRGPDGSAGQFTPTAQLDIPFSQDSIGSTIPTFGGFDPASAANFGFAILSDIEVFFLIQAAKGDQRTNLTQAPTVTMFNGQTASISDFSSRPFVTSVIPVVGDFAVAQQPVVSIIPEGAIMNVSATTSDDRRFVKLSMVPYFSQITDVKTFTFEGSRTTRQTNSSFLQDLLSSIGGGTNPNTDPDLETSSTGTTIQQPVTAVTTVSTVVSVPDGGTVLLGGIKRMQERRIERGVPFLSNIPYVNRLFKNVGIGRETSNLMMMVTPRIIIQEEEERKQVGPIGGN